MLHVRDDDKELLNGYRLRSIIEKYSDHISVPILMPAEPTEPTASAKPAKPAEPAELAEPAEPAEAEGDTAEPAEAYTTVNQASALWTRPQSELSEQDYNEFYKHIASDYTDPIAYVHSKIEGRYEYTMLLFIPSHAPYDLWLARPRHGLRLHVRRVFIMEDDGQLMPRYLRFVRGILDSADLPLNMSRELLQSSQLVEQHSVQRGQEGAEAAQGHGAKRTGQVRHILEGIRCRAQGGHGRGLLQPGRDRPTAPLAGPPRRPAPTRTSRWPTTCRG